MSKTSTTATATGRTSGAARGTTGKAAPPQASGDTVEGFAKGLAQLVQTSGRTYQELADGTGVSTSAVGSWLSGSRLLPKNRLQYLLKACGGNRKYWVRRWEALNVVVQEERVNARLARRTSASPQPVASSAAWTAGDSPELFAQDLTALVQASGLQGRDLAGLLGNSPNTVSNWFTGKRLPKLGNLQLIVQTCRGDVDDWTARWRALKLGAAATRGDKAPNIAQLIADAIVRELPEGTSVKITIEIQAP